MYLFFFNIGIFSLKWLEDKRGPAVLKIILADSPELWSVAAVIFASRICLEDHQLHRWFEILSIKKKKKKVTH